MGNTGLDAAGRTVATFATARFTRWWTYDIGRNVARPIVLPSAAGCQTHSVAIWRTRLAYDVYCAKAGANRRSGIYLRTGDRTQKVTGGHVAWGGLLLRGGTLAAIIDAGDGDASVWRLTVGGKPCPTMLPDSYGVEEWPPTEASLWGDQVRWIDGPWRLGQGAAQQRPSDFALLGARLRGCGFAPRTGIYPFGFPSRATPGRVVAFDGRDLYYADGAAVRRHRLPSVGPSTAPPANDDFEHATRLPSVLPTAVKVRVGYATRQAGETVLAGGRRTVWYAYTPTSTDSVFIHTNIFAPISGLGVFSGDTVATLVPAGGLAADHCGEEISFNPVAGQTYWIGIAAPRFTFKTFTLSLNSAATATC